MAAVKKVIVAALAAAMIIGTSFPALAYQWIQDDTGWKYGEHNGYFTTYKGGWQEIDGKWYYFDYLSNYMAHDTVVGGYTLGSDGAWDGSAPAMPDELDKTNPLVPQYTYSFLSGGPNAEIIFTMGHTYYRFKVDGEYLTSQWVRIYSKDAMNHTNWIAYVYVDEDGLSLESGETMDGFVITGGNVYEPPVYNAETGKRNLLPGDTIKNSIEPLEERVDTNGNTYYLLSPDTTSISFEYMEEIDEGALELDFAASGIILKPIQFIHFPMMGQPYIRSSSLAGFMSLNWKA